jgi:hypothetical protein
MIGPSRTVRRQRSWPPSAVVTASEGHEAIWKDPGFRKLLVPIIAVYLTQVCTGYDATLTSNLQSFKEWKTGRGSFCEAHPYNTALTNIEVEMGSPNSSQLGLISAIYFMGCLVGSFPAAIVTDKL